MLPTLFRISCIVLGVLGIGSVRAAGPATLAADINLGITGRFSAEPSGFVRLGDLSYFTACDRRHGCELWRSDGTAAGTQIVADLCPGNCSSSPRSLAVAFGSTLYFAANDGEHGEEPFAYRPEFGQPQFVGDVNPGAAGSSPSGFVSTSNGFLAGVFFVARIGVDEFSSSNAIVRITESSNQFNRFTALAPGTLTGLVDLRVLGDRLLFSATDGTHGRELWSLRATASNVFAAALVRDILPGSGSAAPTGLTVHPSLVRMFFAASDAAGNSEPWISDGTTGGTVKLAELKAGQAGSAPREFTVAGSRLFFTADDTASASGNNRELFVTGGTTGTTAKVLDINPSTTSGSSPMLLRRMPDNRVMLLANDGSSGDEMWISDGSAAGTTRVADLVAGGGGITGVFGTDAEVNGGFYYVIGGARAWRSDGTAAGSRQVGSALPDPITGFRAVHAAGSRMLFQGDSFDGGSELFQSPLASPQSLTQVNVIGDEIGHSDPIDFHVLPGGEIAIAFDDLDGFEWRRLLPGGGQELLVDLQPGANSFDPVDDITPTESGTHLWFVANFVELWRTDGSIAGTQRVFDFGGSTSGGEDDFGNIVCLVAEGEEVIVMTRNFSPSRTDLFRSDGTAAGTQRLLGPGLMPPGLTLDYFPCPEIAGSSVIVVAFDNATGYEPYRNNGTPGQLSLLRDIAPGGPSSQPERMQRVGNRVFMVASDDGTQSNQELWVTDGTAQGTRLVREINPSGPSRPNFLTPVGDRLYFAADDGVNGRELHRSDGTAAGTQQVADLFPGPGAAFPLSQEAARAMQVDGVRLFFAATTPEGNRLFVSDGTAAGTMALAPSEAPSGLSPRDLARVDGGIVFSGVTAAHGRELWFSDGTHDGTLRVTDIAEGPVSASPSFIRAGSDVVLFSAHDDVHGREPWRFDITRSVEVFRDGFE
jgi:ELWxxDGT repeat protein